MTEIQLGVIEARFADMIWEREPVTSSELVKLAAEAFTWKRTTHTRFSNGSATKAYSKTIREPSPAG